MRRNVVAVLVVVLVIGMLGIGASPAGAAYFGLPQVATPDVAHVYPFDGTWWAGGYGWAGYTTYAPGTPIPAEKFIIVNFNWMDPDKSLTERLPEIELFSLTVRGDDGVVVVRTTEAESAQFWGKVARDPTVDAWYRAWSVPLGQLPAGTYKVTIVDHLTTAVEASLLDESGDWYLTVIKPYKDTYRSSFTVQ